MSRLSRFTCFSLFLFFSSSLWATTSIQTLLERSEELKLSQTDAWLALGHYRQNGLMGGWKSQADDTAFFLSSQGVDNPKAELHATIRALWQVEKGEPDQHAQCRFPARYNWLKKALSVSDDDSPIQPCPEYEEWFETINPGSATLIFPAAYINGPSSMFGHTLLRINPNDDRSGTPLVAYALNYAASTDGSDNGMMFAFKGIFGGYPGSFALVPYYEKIKQYSDMENRDIWEYQLNLSLDEVKQLMRHAWEVRKIRFDYFFFDENCSYRLLVMLDVARPGLKLAEQFSATAIPADTVRVIERAQLFDGIDYRPSNTTILKHRLNSFDEHQRESLVAVLEQEPMSPNLEPQQKARQLELAYDLLLYSIRDENLPRDPRSGYAYQLLKARSNVTESAQWDEPEQPEIRAEQGHLSRRVALTLGRSDEQEYVGMRLRPAYHDVLDPSPGYGKGMQINFLDVELRYYDDTNQFKLEQMKIIDILSLSPRDKFFKPISWGADFGVQKQLFGGREIHPLQVTAKGGGSYQLGRHWLGAVFAQFQLAGHHEFSEQLNLGLGPSINLLYQHENAHSLITVEGLDFNWNDDYKNWNVQWQLNIPINAQNGIRLNAQRKRYGDSYFNEFELGWQRYF